MQRVKRAAVAAKYEARIVSRYVAQSVGNKLKLKIKKADVSIKIDKPGLAVNLALAYRLVSKESQPSHVAYLVPDKRLRLAHAYE